MADPVQTIIIGGGISGLACAYYLRKSGIRALVLESSGRPGGMISSSVQGDVVLEEGPQSFLSTDALLEIARDLGLEAEILRASASSPRFVFLNCQLRRVPMNPPHLMVSSLLSSGTKLTLLRDAVGRSVPPESDESVATFVRRKFTQELLDRIVSPFISGVFAGDPEHLSLRAAFPTVYQAEKVFGSVIRGAGKVVAAEASVGDRPASRKDRAADSLAEPSLSHGSKNKAKIGSGHTLISFWKGNESLVRALASFLGEDLMCGVRVNSVDYHSPGDDAGAQNSSGSDSPVKFSSGSASGSSSGGGKFTVYATEAGRPSTFVAPSLVVATPAYVASSLLAPLSANFVEPLANIEYAPVAVVSSIYRRNAIAHSLEGFGFLVPRTEGLRILGTIWNTSLFPNRAPEGHAVLTSFAGGVTDPGLIDLRAQNIIDLIHKELARVLAITGEPEQCTLKLYQRAIPQYNLGHSQRVDSLGALCADFPGLFLAGNYLKGPSIGACVEQARTVIAPNVRNFLSSTIGGIA